MTVSHSCLCDGFARRKIKERRTIAPYFAIFPTEAERRKVELGKNGAICFTLTAFLYRSLCSKDPVSGITQSRADVGVLIQAAIQMPDINLDVWMILVQSLQTFRCSDD